MALPINIPKLLQGKTVEWERLEFKANWNPEAIVKTMCAFANDLNNWGGGYIIIGVEERDGLPVMPPKGVKENALDKIQKQLVELSYKISPNYFPIAQPYQLEGNHILVLWCPAGESRPYTCPIRLGPQQERVPYIRVASTTIKARGSNLVKLNELSSRIPFDDRINNQAKLEDFDIVLIRSYLQRVRSDLYKQVQSLSLKEIAQSMQIARGTNELTAPINVGLLFFCQQPERFFKRAWIELVIHQSNDGSKFKEICFKGPVQQQINEVMNYFSSSVIFEQVEKRDDSFKAYRYFNYPLIAIREAIVNAVYHKSYELSDPIEIQVWDDRVEILSYPAPMAPVDEKALARKKRITSRAYRNRRIGDFLKELDLTEGRGTGFPKIYESMEQNESPPPIFETDGETYVLVTLPAKTTVDHTSWDGVKEPLTQYNTVGLDELMSLTAANSPRIDITQPHNAAVILQMKNFVKEHFHHSLVPMLEMAKEWVSPAEMLQLVEIEDQVANRSKYLEPLIESGWIEAEFADQPNEPDQHYHTTIAGNELLRIIEAASLSEKHSKKQSS